MALQIAPATIDQIKSAAQIEEVVGDFVSLKRKGQNLWACCPFHNERTPSFSVSPNKNFFKCFGCGKAGDAISFVMEVEGAGYLEALKYLAKKYGIEVQEEEMTPQQQLEHNERESLHIVLKYAEEHFQHNLFEVDEGKSIGLSYFKERGYHERTIETFQLGYALDQWQGLLDAATKSGYSKEKLLQAGLILESDKGDRSYDRFRGRVIFPIHNLTGKPIAFGARMLGTDKKQPKYINSPETELYNKSEALYGIFQAKKAIRQEENCYLVEGYTDVISMHQAGVENVVASSGTSLTTGQIRLIRRFSEAVTILYDGDSAGLMASLRGIDLILEEGLNVRVLLFPQGDDPDSYVRKVGPDAFKHYLETHSQDFLHFRADLAKKEAGHDPVKMAGEIREIVGSISRIPDPIKRNLFLRECSVLLQIKEEVLITEMNKVLLMERRQRDRREVAKESTVALELETYFDPSGSDDADLVTKDPRIALERELVRLLLNYGAEEMQEEGEYRNLADYILQQTDDLEFQSPLYARILERFKSELAQGRVLTLEQVMTEDEEEVKQEAIHLSTDRHSFSENWKKFNIHVPKEHEVLTNMATNTIVRLKWTTVKMMIRENNDDLKKAEKMEDIERCLHISSALKGTERQLAEILGNVVYGKG